jgi:hypothetical protein
MTAKIKFRTLTMLWLLIAATLLWWSWAWGWWGTSEYSQDTMVVCWHGIRAHNFVCRCAHFVVAIYGLAILLVSTQRSQHRDHCIGVSESNTLQHFS